MFNTGLRFSWAPSLIATIKAATRYALDKEVCVHNLYDICVL